MIKCKRGFTLLEVLVSIMIISTISIVGIPKLLPLIKEFSIKENTAQVITAINESRNTAIRRSGLIYIDFSQANTNHDDKGGLIKIFKGDDTLVSQIYLDKNVIYNSNQSTIQSNIIYFDYKGRPSDDQENINNFTSENNRVAVSYINNKGSVVLTKILDISPFTGKVIQLQ